MWAAVGSQFRYGGITSVSRATGLSRTTIHAGVSELEHETESFSVEAYGVVRRLGSGRKPLTQSDPTLLTDLESLVEPVTRVTQNHPCGGQPRVW